MKLDATESQNGWVGRDPKDHEAPTPHQPPHFIAAQAAQGPIQPGLERLRDVRDTHSLSVQHPSLVPSPLPAAEAEPQLTTASFRKAAESSEVPPILPSSHGSHRSSPSRPLGTPGRPPAVLRSRSAAPSRPQPQPRAQRLPALLTACPVRRRPVRIPRPAGRPRRRRGGAADGGRLPRCRTDEDLRAERTRSYGERKPRGASRARPQGQAAARRARPPNRAAPPRRRAAPPPEPCRAERSRARHPRPRDAPAAPAMAGRDRPEPRVAV